MIIIIQDSMGLATPFCLLKFSFNSVCLPMYTIILIIQNIYILLWLSLHRGSHFHDSVL